jgi:SagB-type dehydrogenase family enzyme
MRYPLEYYFLIQNSSEFKTGVYHYNIKEHALEFLKELKESEIPFFSVYPWVRESSCVMFVTGVFDRTMRKYGERGYRYILLEAGHVGQNIYLVGNAIGLSVRAVMGVNDIGVESFLGIDGIGESLVYNLTIG